MFNGPGRTSRKPTRGFRFISPVFFGKQFGIAGKSLANARMGTTTVSTTCDYETHHVFKCICPNNPMRIMCSVDYRNTFPGQPEKPAQQKCA